MKVKELKKILNKMDENQEVPLNVIMTLSELKNKRLYANISFPKEGIPISELIEEDELENMLGDADVTNGDITDLIMNMLNEYDIIYNLESEYITYEVR